MARHTKLLTIQEEKPGYRDNGKAFLITEMSADQGERWANRLIFALANAGANLPDGALNGGMAGLASVGVAGAIIESMRSLQYAAVEPLLDEMMGCIQYKHGPSVPLQAIVAGANCQIEEIQTFWTLRLAWVELTVGFSLAGAAQSTKTSPPPAPPAS